MIKRKRHLEAVLNLLGTHPVVALLGARQVGKTTLALDLANKDGTEAEKGADAELETGTGKGTVAGTGEEHKLDINRWGSVTRFDLEDPDDLARLAEPKLALGSLVGLVIIDEVQRRPDLFPVLRVLVDRPHSQARFLLLGSASPELLRQSSETLAGRIAYHELDGFALDEVGQGAADDLWLRGGFPRSFLADNEGDSLVWRRAFIRTFLERDLPMLGIGVPAPTLHRFWQMLAHYHAQTWNGAELGRAFGMSATTVRRYLDILEAALVIRTLPPWFENIGKRQVRSPRVYVRDTGLLHGLLGIEDFHGLVGHPKVGASWEGFVMAELMTHLGALPQEGYFWATHAGAELDLLVVRGERRRGFEIKRTTSPTTTRSMHLARASLGLRQIEVIHAGEHTFPLTEEIRAVAFTRLTNDVEPL
ncbi:MAG: ATP-binding protein [Polyangia bacterium]|jgi:predicted AAA+ superfamily ATPase|nr:ATP-binding protein [Polyangia bacterium]